MESTLSTLPSSSFRPPSSTTISLKSHFDNPLYHHTIDRNNKPTNLAIRSAISRTKKRRNNRNSQTQTPKQIQSCHLIAGIKYKGFTVSQFQQETGPALVLGQVGDSPGNHIRVGINVITRQVGVVFPPINNEGINLHHQFEFQQANNEKTKPVLPISSEV